MFDLKRMNVRIATIIGIRYYVNQFGGGTMFIKTIIETILYLGLASAILAGVLFGETTLPGVVLIGIIIMVIISIKATQQ